MLDGVKLFLSLFRVRLPADPVAMEEMTQQVQPSVPLDRALLCLDCDSIFAAENAQRCPRCGSAVAWAMGRALNRELPQMTSHGAATAPVHDAGCICPLCAPQPTTMRVRPRGGDEQTEVVIPATLPALREWLGVSDYAAVTVALHEATTLPWPNVFGVVVAVGGLPRLSAFCDREPAP